MTDRKLKCPECGGGHLVKVGFVWSGRQRKQQYRCHSCGRLTIRPLTGNQQLAPQPA